ncbi:MAG: AraC family transcriptional regulator, partial [Bacteroidota bacterium]
MEIQNELLFFFSALGAFNGLLMGAYFLCFVKPKHPSHLFLGALLLAVSVRVGKSVFFYFHDDLALIYVQLGLFACWFIGPFLYFYVKAALEVEERLKKEALIHLAILLPVALGLFLAFPRSENPFLWSEVFIYLIYGQWFLYVAGTWWVYIKNRSLLENKQTHSFSLWLLSILGGNTLICLAFITGNYTSYIAGALCFSFLFYLLILLLFFSKKRTHLLLLHPPKYGQRKLSEEIESALSFSLKQLMEEEEIYKDPNLNLTALAKRLNVMPAQLSQYVNEHIGVSF